MGAADFTYDGFGGTGGLIAARSSSSRVGGGPGGSGGLIIGGAPGGGPYGGLGSKGTIIPGGTPWLGSPAADKGGRISGGGGGGRKRDMPGGNTSDCMVGIIPGLGTGCCCLGGGGGGGTKLATSMLSEGLLASFSSEPSDGLPADFGGNPGGGGGNGSMAGT